MAKYDPWDSYFETLEGDEVTLSFEDLEKVIGTRLPPSASNYAEWWSGAQYYARWTRHGWRARPRVADRLVVFLRSEPRGIREDHQQTGMASANPRHESDADLILVGCVSQKRGVPSLAKDLYSSPLWRKRRAYAEATAKPWIILSAEYGLVDPDEVIEPYDRNLESQNSEYRRNWSSRIAAGVVDAADRLGAETIEIHAGSAYVDYGLADSLLTAGLRVSRPLQGMRIGEQLAWYDSTPAEETQPHRIPMDAAVVAAVSADHVQRIANDYNAGRLGESWGELPETLGAFLLPDADERQIRIWLTFVCAMDRARNAEALWSAGLVAWQDDPWVFDPSGVVAHSFADLTETLRRHRLSQRHSQDAAAWRLIAETILGAECPVSVQAVLAGGPVDAADLLEDLGSQMPNGTPRFPLLSGPKIGPLWVRVMAYPGGAEILGIDVIPVAVDTHVQRVTEMLGLVPIGELDEGHRSRIQSVWFDGVRLAGPFGGPDAIDGTAVGIDPALWVLGKNGCARCESESRKVPIGSICSVCPTARLIVG